MPRPQVQGVPVVLLDGLSPSDVPPNAVVLDKPFDRQELQQAVQQARLLKR